ncbi:hypothetical protein KUCAC02_022347 [Chaenocephalus aceratus]|uniref:Uncharacterized protein n=1 Tax=Chaenocephalus aceratus TaxID=36190 RepID=A0ACB9XMF9_CHAAC|nr:hypothetical protein KUCAC02_022347 [Chaenocephalus aceratus]
MSSSELESTDSPVSEDEEGKIYQLIYDLIPANDKEGKEDVQIVCRELNPVKCFTAYNDTRALYREELSYFEETPALNGDTESSAERPWRLSGADITDYFNYGFDEEIWKMYCKKQAEVHAANGKLYLDVTGMSPEADRFSYNGPSPSNCNYLFAFTNPSLDTLKALMIPLLRSHVLQCASLNPLAFSVKRLKGESGPNYISAGSGIL